MKDDVKNESFLRTEMRKNFKQYTMIIIMVFVALIFSIMTGGTFISSRNISNLFLQASAVAIVAMSVSMVLVAGHIDLSIGSCVGLAGAVSSTLMVGAHWGTIPTVLVTLAVGALVGSWQGFWVAYRNVPSFIVTLAGNLIFRGMVLGITRGMTIAPLNDSFKAIGQGYIPSIFTAADSGFNDTAVILGVIVCLIIVFTQFSKRASRKKYNLAVQPLLYTIVKTAVICAVIMGVVILMSINRGISYALLLVMLIAVVFSYIASNSSFGRHIYAIGGNKEAARLSGINIKKRIFILFVIMGTMCSISGIVYTARINAGTAAAGTNMEMDAISAAIIGGTSTMGGEGSVLGAIIGALIMTFIDNGMSLLNLDNTYQYIIKGMVLLLAVWMDVATRKKDLV